MSSVQANSHPQGVLQDSTGRRRRRLRRLGRGIAVLLLVWLVLLGLGGINLAPRNDLGGLWRRGGEGIAVACEQHSQRNSPAEAESCNGRKGSSMNRVRQRAAQLKTPEGLCSHPSVVRDAFGRRARSSAR